ncbi:MULTISPECIES: hypothetical protein [unclassified Paenibacillus]|uniref:hypothetical protein n=1 Tax=unclassified Paenibacillus TaxID=185978 RepID=UPI000956E6A1|nr:MULTISPECIES: hypothetical protein [unclassified Paenibacillus]ASS67466.1 hypothetical protein CIC07_15940 [Paenibacillus sp. RUD330]SIQ76052.1 hypothetical protein SAMN05880555_2242 [Paenibacillus sp. RU4X]SIQ97514.1 hypothetical protein SAMN05880570_2241 [Paenibacillus sp. RU4T]
MNLKKIKARYLILILLLLALGAPFVLWLVSPSKELDIVVLNKTFPVETKASGSAKQLDYSKQRGLFWLMDHLKIRKPENGKAYGFRTDYYGNFMSGGKLVNKPLQKLDRTPDAIFISDTYGTGNSRAEGVEAAGISGLTKEEVGFIATSYAKGATVIGEYNIAGDPTSPSVSNELESIFGVSFTGMAGKFFSDLSSNADVPNWIRATYEQQYGKKWSLTGAGIVIAGNSRIVVLQRDAGFTGSSVQLSMDEEHQGDYGTQTVDYYNWFEIVNPVKDASVLAWYRLNLTDEGQSQLKPFGLDGRFPAIISHSAGGKHAFYLAGDFTDYRGPTKVGFFTGASTLYRYFSVKSEGDLSYFYWHFYVPFMSKVLKDTNMAEREETLVEDQPTYRPRLDGKQFSVYKNGSRQSLYVNGVDIGATLPGYDKGELPDAPAFYADWFSKIAGMNANTIRVYTLMPSVFYRALDIYNHDHPDRMLYLLQNIALDEKPRGGNYLDADYRAAFARQTETVIDAIHGHAEIKQTDGKGSELYANDVSGYLLGYLIDLKLSAENVEATDAGNASFTFAGDYATTEGKGTPTENGLASLLDKTYAYEQAAYGMQHAVGAVGIPELEAGYQERFGPADDAGMPTVDLGRLLPAAKLSGGIFSAYDVFPDKPAFQAADSAGKPSYPEYGSYIKHLTTRSGHPVLISEFGLSTGSKMTEAEQGEGLATLIRLIRDSGAAGGLLYEWADEWGKSSGQPLAAAAAKRRNLWHNTVDPAQNYGILALEPPAPAEYSMTLRGSGPLSSIAYAADESYFHIKAEFSQWPDFSRQQLMIYLDTVDRKEGEYMLAPDVNENWSGAEFQIRLDSKDKAELLVMPSYNASRGSYYTAVSSTGLFEQMIRMESPEYVTKGGRKIEAVYSDESDLSRGTFATGGSSFYMEGKTLYVRIPWTRLNFIDPSSLLVWDDDKNTGLDLPADSLSVRMTDGIVGSLVIMDKQTRHVDYHFPESVTSSGYRTFSWSAWDAPDYASRAKGSYDAVKEAFSH